jgi:hypothetical protein
MLLFIYDNAPPLSEEGTDVTTFRIEDGGATYSMNEEGVYWLDPVVLLGDNSIWSYATARTSDVSAEDSMKYLPRYRVMRNGRNRYELIERAFSILVIWNISARSKGPESEVLAAGKDDVGAEL